MIVTLYNDMKYDIVKDKQVNKQILTFCENMFEILLASPFMYD